MTVSTMPSFARQNQPVFGGKELLVFLRYRIAHHGFVFVGTQNIDLFALLAEGCFFGHCLLTLERYKKLRGFLRSSAWLCYGVLLKCVTRGACASEPPHKRPLHQDRRDRNSERMHLF